SHHTFNIELMDIVATIGLAVVTAAASLLLTRAIRNMHHTADRISLSPWLKAAAGGALVGLIGMWLPLVMGEGYHAIRDMIEGGFEHGLLLVAIYMVAKILATSLTLGSGGSGGIFAPCLVIGSFAGLAYHRALVILWPDAGWVGEGCFALLGMAGMVGGILQAPLTAIFLIVEITGGYEVILPLIIVSALSATLCRSLEPASFYLKDLVEKGQLLRPGTDARVLADLNVQELLETDCLSVPPDMLLRDFIEVIKQSHRNLFPVESAEEKVFMGMINLADIRPFLFDPVLYDTVFVEQIMDRNVATVGPDEEIHRVLARMDTNGLFSMPVVVNGRFVGLISKATLLDQYRKELMVQTVHLKT
ncbi:MAG: chloride channel protein, partial [Desulfobacterales bacterium]